jgi:DNA recombination protein RmuC
MPDMGQIGSLANQIQHVDSASRASFERLARDLGELNRATQQMMEVGKTITSLENLLRPPQLRGGMGETLLAELLSQILPGHFELQHRFKSGERVDAVIRLGNRLAPVDAKFPLESFRRLAESKDQELARKEKKVFIRTLKAHVDAIAQKYILPDEGTYDFALMYIPAENVYYETVLRDEEGEGLYPYALQKRVIPVSPNSFYAYLQVIIHGLKGLHIEERAREIVDYLARLRADEERFRQDFETLGTHIENARKKYEDAQRKLVRFEDKLLEAGGTPEPGITKN